MNEEMNNYELERKYSLLCSKKLSLNNFRISNMRLLKIEKKELLSASLQIEWSIE